MNNTRKQKLPKILYKYKSFDSLALDLLISDKVYCANPADFNDPLDTRPCVNTDLSLPELEEVLRILIENRVLSEMRAAARSIKYRGPKTAEHIQRHSRRQAQTEIASISYYATDPMYTESAPVPQIRLLGDAIEKEILRVYEKGILSLAEKFDCPLMWSHYGNQHYGICIGYRIPTDAELQLFKVHYGGEREIEASKIKRMLEKQPGAQIEVDSSVLLKKAYEWKYEKEWRFIGNRGLMSSPFDLAEITFGSRCPNSTKFALIKALENRTNEVEFFEICEQPGIFKLKRRHLDKNELCSYYPIDNQTFQNDFSVWDCK